MVTDILSRTVSELSQLIVQISDTAFSSHPFGGLETTYDVHLGLIGKCVVDFLLVLRMSRYERKEIDNLRFRSNEVTLIQNFR